jgi:hypothetical protein
MPDILNGTLHPYTAAILDEIGVAEVMQASVPPGDGAKASKGFHDYCGKFNGTPFGVCFDLHYDSTTKALRDKLVAAGICVFPRYAGGGWNGSPHVHAVHVGLPDDSGKVSIGSGPREQINDFAHDRNGLYNHAPWRGKWAPNDREAHDIYSAYKAWVPDVATRVRVFDTSGHYVSPTCYAWLEAKQQVFCEVRALVEGLGGTLLAWSPESIIVRGHAPIALPGGYLAGDFGRGPVRLIAEALGYKVGFEWSADKASCVVTLRKAVS